MSASLIWQLTRAQNAFIVKGGPQGELLSRHPLNLTNKHNFRSSGLANRKALGVAETKDGVVITYKKTAGSAVRKPASSTDSVTLTRGTRRALRVASKLTKGRYYRADLQSDALARVSRLLGAQRAAKRTAKPAKTHRKKN